MMKKLVKILSLTLIAAMLLVGCSGGTAADGNAANDVAPSVPEDEEVTLKVTFFEAGFGNKWQN